MHLISVRDSLCPVFREDSTSTDAIDFLTTGAGASHSEQMIVRTMLDALALFSSWTAKHSLRLGLQVTEFSRVLGYSNRDAFRFGLCAALHDIGKLSIPITMIEKPGKFSNEEYEMMRTHVIADLACLDYFSAPNREPARHIIRLHHENFDGTGYPDGLAGGDIPEIAQIGRICDFFDAVHSDRPYRAGLSRRDTLSLMQQNANAFNPAFFKAFTENISAIDRDAIFSLR